MWLWVAARGRNLRNRTLSRVETDAQRQTVATIYLSEMPAVF